MLRIKKSVPYPENIIQEIFQNPNIEITEDMKDGFYHVLGSLNDLQQEALYLRYAKRKTLKQTKEELNLTDYKTQNLIHRSVRALRHPRASRYIRYGLDYINTLEKEEIMRQERYSNKAYLAQGVPLADLEEISAKTYTALYRKGFGTLYDVNLFIKEKGSGWHKLIPSIGIRGKDEVEEAVRIYRLNEIDAGHDV